MRLEAEVFKSLFGFGGEGVAGSRTGLGATRILLAGRRETEQTAPTARSVTETLDQGSSSGNTGFAFRQRLIGAGTVEVVPAVANDLEPNVLDVLLGNGEPDDAIGIFAEPDGVPNRRP